MELVSINNLTLKIRAKQNKAKSHIVPEQPTEQLVTKYLEKFRSDERYFLADEAISQLVKQFPKNSDLNHVLLKVTVINDLYRTNIFATFRMAHHIHSLNIDPHLATGSTDVVDKIAAVSFSGKKRTVFSFASKYCSWHDQQNYPLYDGFVEKLLLAYRAKDKFVTFKNSDLRRYASYKRIVEGFRDYYTLGKFSFKELDKFLWLYGKSLYPKNYIHETRQQSS